MLNFKRLFLLLVVAVLAYAFWPRKSSLVAFDPTQMAELQLAAAQQAATKSWFACGVTTYRIFQSQYHFPPAAAVKAALEQTRATALFRSASDPTDKEAAVTPLIAAYAEIKSRTGASFDAKAAATQQVQVWSLLETDSPEEATRVLAAQLALVHGGDTSKYLQPARDFVAAATAAKSAAWPAVDSNLKKAWAGVLTAAK
jgi:hypothetical protein